jgi:DNA-binding IclR family transcriptional regulator
MEIDLPQAFDKNLPSGAGTLVKGLSVLYAVDAGASTLSQVQEATGLSKSTAHRLVQTLRSLRFLHDSSDEKLTLGPALIELGFSARSQISLQSVAHPVMMDLAEEFKDTVHLAVEEEHSAFYLDKVHGRRNIEVRSWPGCRMPLTYTGIGKALLLNSPHRWKEQYAEDRNSTGRKPYHDFKTPEAFVTAMKKYFQQGFSYDLEENELGIRCVATPIFGSDGSTVGAISISGLKNFMSPRRMLSIGESLRSAALDISHEIGYRA